MSLDAAPVYITIEDMFYLKHSTLMVFPELYRRSCLPRGVLSHTGWQVQLGLRGRDVMACLGITSQGHDPPGKLTTEKEEWSESGVHLCGVIAAGHAGAHVSFNIGRRSGVGGSLPTRLRVWRGQAPCTCMGMGMESLFTGTRRMTRAADGNVRRIQMQSLRSLHIWSPFMKYEGL